MTNHRKLPGYSPHGHTDSKLASKEWELSMEANRKWKALEKARSEVLLSEEHAAASIIAAEDYIEALQAYIDIAWL